MPSRMPSRPIFGQPVPPPYRAPPRLPYPQQQQQQQHQQQQQQQYQGPPPPAFSKFNVSEPNVALNTSGNVPGGPATGPMSGTFDRHTINHEHSQRVQVGLRNLLGSGAKHQTLDGQGQAAALQHLRSNGIQPPTSMDPIPNGHTDMFTSPDALRDTANRLFTRNHNERASFGGVANMGLSPPGQPQVPNHRPGFNPQVSNGPARFSTPVGNSRHPQPMSSAQQMENGAKRLSYTNQSFRQAMSQEQQLQQMGKVPPQVPPKPFSRSTSRERLKDEPPNDSSSAANALDDELRTILSGGRGGGFGTTSITPPLPALSPVEMTQHNNMSNNNGYSRKQRENTEHSNSLNHRPDLLGNAEPAENKRTSLSNMQQSGQHSGKGLLPPGAALDLERVLAVTGGVDTSATDEDNDDEDDEASTAIDIGDAASIRKQLDGLENMYSEVLKLLGLKKYGRPPHQANMPGGELRTGFQGRRSKLYGSMSSLPSVSSIGSRHLYKGDRRHYHHKTEKSRSGDRSAGSNSGSRDRNNSKRFQRLESHVVTLARSVAHLSSEMRSQHLIIQEIEALRSEVEQLRILGHQHQQQHRQPLEPEQFFSQAAQGGANFPASGIVSPLQANRVKKLTKFFGDEPPLLRLFLKNMGYEKYAGIFEESKIGMLELPYLAEERLEKLGIPLGPRMRIMQECRVATAGSQRPLLTPSGMQQQHHQQQQQQHPTDTPNYNVYIL